MDRSSADQAIQFLAAARRGVLVVAPNDPTHDTFAAMVALGLALDHIQKPTTMLCASHVPPPLQFLPGTSQVCDVLPASPELRLEIPLGDRRPGFVNWEVRDRNLIITVQPEDGRVFPETEVRVRRGEYPWEGVVTVGAPRLHAIGDVFTRHTGFFYSTPILNIDRGASNDLFGTVNLVSMTAGTVSEVVADFLEALGGTSLLTPEVSTCLLAGLVAGTDSFRTVWTTPRTFRTASLLVDQRADRHTIVRRLFQTHGLGELRLLGRALAHVEELAENVVWSALHRQDFAETQTTPDESPAVMHDLLQWVGEHRSIILALERSPGQFEILIAIGRVSADDREVLRQTLNGVLAGPWVLVNAGPATGADVRRTAQEKILPLLPRRVDDQVPGE